MGTMRKAYILVRKSGGQGQLETARRKWEDYIKTDLKSECVLRYGLFSSELG